MPVPSIVSELVERFERHAEAYRSAQYNETQLRREFLDPLFEALGWDVHNRQGFAEAYKDVIHEDAIKIGGRTKAPDCCFRIGGARKFFVEAKKPAVNVKEDVSAAFQLRRYAWSAKLPLSILSDFEETAVYDCRTRPDKNDKSSTARLMLIGYRELTNRWEELAAVFSREALLKGSFDRFVESNRGKRGTAEVDAAFLREIESWREQLARNFALRNPDLEQRELNFAVQRTIDRIIFLRICEDRGAEDYGRLLAVCNGVGVYARLGELFQRADERYNSGLFHFQLERERSEPPDETTLSLKLDDKVLRDLVRNLYYPESPYEFSVLPAVILGQVYEQFLGKVIRLTAGHRAVVEDKPEVKKAGGVYYTPTYIVEHIVEQTIGRELGGRTPGEIDKLTVLDPACGSGSFLIGAFEYLLDWHLRWYCANDPARHARGKRPRIFQGPTGDWRLTTGERKRILLNNLYGVDIDSQAVEVTKLSLLLKVLEGENQETIERQRRLFHERVLPDLGRNIKCGNSLIGSDFFQGRQLPLFGEEDRYRINAFDWRREFAPVFKAGGFDVVLGNPPYGAEFLPGEVAYLRREYATISRNADSFGLFIERAIALARPGGRIAMIVPTGWYSGAQFGQLRRHVACQVDPELFVNLPYDVFRAWVDTTVFVFRRRRSAAVWPRDTPCTVQLITFPKRQRIASSAEFNRAAASTDFVSWFATGRDEFLTYSDFAGTRLMQKIESRGRPLSDFADVQRGVTPFQLTLRPTHRTSKRAFSGTVRRYSIVQGPRRWVRFDDSLAEPKPERYFRGPRLLLRELISRQFRLQAAKLKESVVTNKSMQSILARPGGPDLNYLLGILNSRLISWYFLRKSNIAQRDDFPKIVLKETRSLPVRAVDCSQPRDVRLHDRLSAAVEELTAAQDSLRHARSDHEKTVLSRQVAHLDEQIDRTVYELYELSPEEVSLIEGALATMHSPESAAETAE